MALNQQYDLSKQLAAGLGQGGLDATAAPIPAPAVPAAGGSPTTTSATNPTTSADADITAHLARITSSNNPVMQQARTQGLQQANQRGLLNSSMGIQAAQDSAYRVAMPAASQMASQGHNERIAGMNIAAHDREKSASFAAAMENNYAQMFGAIMNNPEIPADVRDKYIAQAGAMRDSNMRLLEQFWGISLNWGGQPSAGDGQASQP